MSASTQIDLFLDSIVNAPVKDDRALMEFPFFSIQKRPLMEPIIYDDGKVTIRVSPGERGIATIWDKDILIYLSSLINERIERGFPVDRTVRFAAHDLLTLTQRGTGKRAYELLKDALFRLRSTTITTSIASAGDTEDRGFGWIDNFRIVRRDDTKGNRVMQAVEVTLNDWMYRAIVHDRRILTISSDYFGLDKGLERRLYELARKHVGAQPEWRIGLEKLASKCGSRQEIRYFKRDLIAIANANTIPDYQIRVEQDARGRKSVIALFTPLPATTCEKTRYIAHAESV
jgi:plasmid replication initiation protein